MKLLVGRDFRFMLQSQSNIIEPVEQAMPDKVVDRKLCRKSLIVAHFALFQVNG